MILNKIMQDDDLSEQMTNFMYQHMTLIKQFKQSVSVEEKRNILKDIKRLRIQRELFIQSVSE